MSSAVSTHFCRPMACVLLQPIQKRDVSSKKTKHWLKCRVSICDCVNSVPEKVQQLAADCVFLRSYVQNWVLLSDPHFHCQWLHSPIFFCVSVDMAVQYRIHIFYQPLLWLFSCSFPQSSLFLRGKTLDLQLPLGVDSFTKSHGQRFTINKIKIGAENQIKNIKIIE